MILITNVVISMIQELDILEHTGLSGPSFHSLQVYSNSLDHLIKDSPTFGYILKTIKVSRLIHCLRCEWVSAQQIHKIIRWCTPPCVQYVAAVLKFLQILKTLFVHLQKEYDDYVAMLLDTQTVKHQVLYEQVEKLSRRGTSNPHRLRKETNKVDTLEKEAKKQLAENERLAEMALTWVISCSVRIYSNC